ncbi:MAG: hypothetical protein J5901_03165, partial [Pseudobutyrivibrio sp.]|nr:hypothetical protein [Pseudobutyrivibrio sp.]
MTINEAAIDRKNNLNIIRLVASLMVLYMHSFAVSVGVQDEDIFYLLTNHKDLAGGIAVYIFFIISGFLICKSYDRSRSLINYAKAHSLPLNLLKEVGLVSVSEKGNREYDFFRERLMIPIRNRYNQVIGYTARTLSDDKSVPKYINSKTSDLYHKEKSIFGIDVAWRAALKATHFVLVEGAPDVMRLQLIGVYQAVACLGSQWTDEQFEILKRYATTLIFVPDIDPPKEGQAFGTGIDKVLKAGE